jgi:hypothetical protein
MAESWYSADRPAGADIALYRHLASPLDDGEREEFHTIWIDLTQSHDELLADMNESTRRHIRLAERAGLTYESFYPADRQHVEEFATFYNDFARAKGLPGVSPIALMAHAEQGHFDLSRMIDGSGRTLIWHSHYRDERFARLRHSGSRRSEDREESKIIGHASRLHHWMDMRRFREAGITVYDFGGWYEGKDDQARLHINTFKEGFGGRRVLNYHCTRPLTIKGRAYLLLSGLRKRFATASAG